jgi:CBS domain-containing protein
MGFENMLCPRCGYDNVPGLDTCSRCLQDLAQIDLPVGHDRVESSLLEDRIACLKPRRAITVNGTTTVRQAIRIMNDEGVGAILIVESNGNLEGILSERDLLMWAADLPPEQLDSRLAREFMTDKPETVRPDDFLARALQKMDVGHYRHLPVVCDEKPVGVISVRDIIQHISRLCKE